MPGEAPLVEQIDTERVERQEDDEQEERQLNDYRHHARRVFQSIMRVLCKQRSKKNVQMDVAFESGNEDMMTYFLVDDDNCAHQGQIEQEPSERAYKQVAERRNDHGVFCLVAPAANRGSGLDVWVDQILFLYRVKCCTGMLAHVRGRGPAPTSQGVVLLA